MAMAVVLAEKVEAGTTQNIPISTIAAAAAINKPCASYQIITPDEWSTSGGADCDNRSNDWQIDRMSMMPMSPLAC